MADFIKSFNRFCPKKKEQFLWIDVILGHIETNEDFQQQIASVMLDDWNIWVYPKILQGCEESVQLSWVEKLSQLIDMEVEVSLKESKTA